MTSPSPEVESELSQLCRSCGFCCDGSLFHRARLMPDEVEPAKRNGLRVIQDKGFEQPCSQLENKICKIYELRPTVCQSFRCKLVARHRDEGGPIEARLRVVRRFRSVREKLASHGFERGSNGEVKFSAEGPDAFAAKEAFQELMHHMEEDFAREQVSDGPQAG
jgi:hypothetical protein